MKLFSSQITTTNKQSERLLSLGIRSRTADMYIEKITGLWCDTPYWRIKNHQNRNDINPAWSFFQLLKMIPSYMYIPGYDSPVQLQISPPLIKYYNQTQLEVQLPEFERADIYENVIDMIEWLIESGNFEKKYLVVN